MTIKEIATNPLNDVSYCIISDARRESGSSEKYYFIPAVIETALESEFSDISIKEAHYDCPLGHGWLFDSEGIEIIRNIFRKYSVTYIELTIDNAYKLMPI